MAILNKKGQPTAGLFVVVGMVLFSVIMVGVLLLVFNYTTEALDQDIVVTNDNQTLAQISGSTIGVMNTAFINTADYIGMGLIAGMVIFMLINAFYLRGKFPTLFIIIDFFILIGAYIFALYVAFLYQTLITSTPYLDVFINNLPNSSTFVLYLNRYVGVIGVIAMIITYSMFPPSKESPAISGDLDYEGAF